MPPSFDRLSPNVMQIIPDASLQPYHSFGFDVRARYIVFIESLADLTSFFTDAGLGYLCEQPEGFVVMGEGSNVLFTEDYAGTVLLIRITGVEIKLETEDVVVVEVGAGESWHAFVRQSIARGWGGLENLSLIPGTVGAAPVQNIGAYGVEVAEFIDAVSVYDTKQHVGKTLSPTECTFGYRDSLFKHIARGRFIITQVFFRLDKHRVPVLNYAPLQARCPAFGNSAPTLSDVSDAVIDIRRSKLPDPAVIGNAGSFFKNPVVNASEFHRLRGLYPDIPGYESIDGVKIPAGWLIERAGWKGFRDGPVGCYEKQALVLVHYGGGTARQLLALARRIQQSVMDQFGVLIEPEVNIISA